MKLRFLVVSFFLLRKQKGQTDLAVGWNVSHFLSQWLNKQLESNQVHEARQRCYTCTLMKSKLIGCWHQLIFKPRCIIKHYKIELYHNKNKNGTVLKDVCNIACDIVQQDVWNAQHLTMHWTSSVQLSIRGYD